jgi:hypothetical protein
MASAPGSQYRTNDGRRGKWTETQDIRLAPGTVRMRQGLSTVAVMVPGRMKMQCQNRWHRVVLHISGEWTHGYVERRRQCKLKNSGTRTAGDWAAIAALVPVERKPRFKTDGIVP